MNTTDQKLPYHIWLEGKGAANRKPAAFYQYHRNKIIDHTMQPFSNDYSDTKQLD